jgi:hypothetical protein
MTTLKRLNVLFHGMMLFDEGDGASCPDIQIYIPSSTCHQFLYGDPGIITNRLPDGTVVQTCDASTLKNLPQSGIQPLQPSGITGTALPLRSHISAAKTLLLKNHKLNINSTAANTYCTLRFPKPGTIRLLRGAEVDSAHLLNGTDPAITHQVPEIQHAVICFSYFAHLSNVTFLDWTAPANAEIANLCIYAESESADNGHSCSGMELNELLLDKSGKKPSFRLTTLATAGIDGEFKPAPSTGLNICHIRMLSEFKPNIGVRTGCLSGFRAS